MIGPVSGSRVAGWLGALLLAGLMLIRPPVGRPAVSFTRPGASPALSYGSLPLAFEPNRGQAAPGATFQARGSGYCLMLDQAGAALALNGRIGEGESGGTDRPTAVPGLSHSPTLPFSPASRSPASCSITNRS